MLGQYPSIESLKYKLSKAYITTKNLNIAEMF